MMHRSSGMTELCRRFRHEYAWAICCIPALGGFSYGFTFALNGLIVVQVRACFSPWSRCTQYMYTSRSGNELGVNDEVPSPHVMCAQDSFINHFCVGTYGDHDSCYKLTTAAQLHDWVAFKVRLVKIMARYSSHACFILLSIHVFVCGSQTQFVATLVLGAMLGTMLRSVYACPDRV
jgi:hypothetical protein